MDRIRDRAIEPILVVPRHGWLTEQCGKLGIPFEIASGLPDAFVTDTAILQARTWIPNAIRIAQLARRHRAVIIHANSPRASYHAGLGARLARIPCVVHVHDAAPEHLPYSVPLKAQVLFRLSDQFIAVSQATAEAVSALLPMAQSRITVVYDGYDAASYENIPRANLRAELNLASDTVLVGSVSAMTPWKGQDVLIRAFPAIHARIPNARLLIVGGTQGAKAQEHYQAQLCNLVAELDIAHLVHFTGWRNDAKSVIRDLDLFVHVPTRPDPLPNVILDALALGCPIVASRIGGIPEMVEDGESGILVPAGDSTALATTVTQVLTDREKLGKIQRNARQRFLQRFCVDQFTEGMLNVYARCVPNLIH